MGKFLSLYNNEIEYNNDYNRKYPNVSVIKNNDKFEIRYLSEPEYTKIKINEVTYTSYGYYSSIDILTNVETSYNSITLTGNDIILEKDKDNNYTIIIK